MRGCGIEVRRARSSNKSVSPTRGEGPAIGQLRRTRGGKVGPHNRATAFGMSTQDTVRIVMPAARDPFQFRASSDVGKW